jgi:alkylation response protein AidB-like acyl-CoA dehydrogenase
MPKLTPITEIPLRIPERWDRKWFDRFIREGLGGYTLPYRGAGVPAASLGVVGDLYTRTDGGTGTTLYVKESGGWISK